MNANELNSERSAKLLATKLDKAYEANYAEEHAVNDVGRSEGFSEENFRALDEIRARRLEIFAQMEALRDAARVRGWCVRSRWLQWSESSARKLINENRD